MSNDLVTLTDGDVVEARSPGEAIRALIEPEKAEIVKTLVHLAKAGDTKSIQLALAYVAPPARGDSERVSIPGFKDAKTLQQKAESVIEAIATGHCTAEAGERLLRVLDTYQRAITATEFEARLAALEGGTKPPTAQLVERVEPEPTRAQRLAAVEAGKPTPVARVEPDDFGDSDFSDLA